MLGDLFDSPLKIAIIAVVILVLFGSAKLPMAARSLGKSMRILKTEVHGLHDDDEQPATAPAPAQIQASPASAPFASAAPFAEAADAVPAHQAQIDALTKQLADLQQQQSASGSAQAK